jgi:23S rRNA (adenine2503-C2)-methyltransferase
MIKKSLCGLTADEIFCLIKPCGFSYSHAVTIATGIYKKGANEVSSIAKLPKKLRCELEAIAHCGIFLPESFEVSADKTVKYLFRTEIGKEFETVYIPDNKRNTVCVSTQSGCRMGCRFCATARYGFYGSLSAGEIINQIISIPDTGKVTHIVFMGMGEPLDNLENVLKACEILTSEWGLSISSRNITVSTVGITAGIENFLQRSDCNLTLSLYSPFPEERKKVIPAEKLYPAHKIIDMMKNYPVKKKRRLSLAYIMIKGLNDTDNHLEELKLILKGSSIRVNLLHFHSVRNDQNVSSTDERMQIFKHALVTSGISASVRKSRGIDISAACGLLAAGLK